MTMPSHWIENLGDKTLTIGSAMHGQTVVVRAGTQVQIEQGVEVRLLERAQCVLGVPTQLHLHPGAIVQHMRLQTSAGVSHLQATQERGSVLKCFTLCAGDGHSTLHTDVQQIGVDADCQIHGLYLAQTGAVVENRVRVVHAVPLGRSRQIFKGLLAQGGKARFHGQIRIEANAQEVDSLQLSTALVLGKHADVVTQPELEILADNVKAAHGATVGQLDDDQLFYMASRGLPTGEAVRLLARGFINEVLMHIDGGEMRQFAWQTLAPAIALLEEQFVLSKQRPP
jgi:Fe-S cluster assembly protein SufD